DLTLGLGVAGAEVRIAEAEVRAELRRRTGEAIARGVFDVPALAIGNEVLWGVEAADMARDFVAAGCRYPDAEYNRVATLPAAAVRKEVAPDPPKKAKTRIIGTAN